MIDLVRLTDEEKLILHSINKTGEPMSESNVHMIFSIMTNSVGTPFDYKFEFELKNKYATKLIEFSSKKLLETFNTTIDLSSFKDLTDIKVSTKRLFKNYHLNIKKNKYINYDDDDVIFNKVSTNINDKKKWNIIISKTTTKNVIEFEIVKLNTSIIYKTLDFYITGKDPNELHEILSIPIERLWENKWIQFELKDDLNNKNIWCNVNSLNILLDDKIIKL